MKNNTCVNVQKDLRAVSSDARKEKNEYFFKTGEGGYSLHDKFIGVQMPDIRKVAKDYEELSETETKKLLYSEIHEDRLCAVLILVYQMKEAVKVRDAKVQKHIYDFYLAHKAQVNNWDIVDASTHYIVGQYILLNPAAQKTSTR